MARRTKRKVLALLPALALAVTAAACAEEIQSGGSSKPGDKVELLKDGELRTCTHLPYAPFQFSQGSKTVGFDVDLVDQVGKDLGVKQTINDTSFEGIESGQSLNNAQCDVAAAAMTITPERQKVMDFSDPYFDADQALLVLKDSGIDSLEQLRGKTLGVQQGTTGEEYAEKNKKKYGYEVKQYEDLALEQSAVLTGQIEAGINDNGVHYNFVKQNPKTVVSAEFDTGEKYGVAVRKGNGALRGKINEVLKKIREDGTYNKIYQKWFGKQPGSGQSPDKP
ncbi:MAG: transporter substrate-binding domain-containing protein [Pseudonocardiaceae bacterium]|nr:transporter substrate-binding domain-containing protein [Pseudonocardiaceae bacterium]